MLLEGKTALITGAGRGIGRAIAESFAREGCRVGITARTASELEETIALITSRGGQALAYPGPVENPDTAKRVVETVHGAFGAIDLLVNNAGVALFKPVWKFTLEEWQRTFDVNLTGAFLFTQAVLPGMMERRSGRIINISSVCGLKALPEQGAYVASKHALNGYTKSLALELRPYNIAVHAICPGAVNTHLSRSAMPHRDPDDWMTPKDIAHTALYLASLSPRAAVDIIPIRRFAGEPMA